MPKGLQGFQKGHKRFTNYDIPKGSRISIKTEFKKGNPPPLHKINCKCFRCDKKLGIKNVLWKGGVTPKNKLAREKLEIRLWRQDVFKRDDYTCLMPKCGQRGGDVEAHHIKRFINFESLRVDINNGVTLCRKCHNSTKGKEEKFEKMFIEILQAVD